MSVYNQRDKPAYGANAGLDTAYGKNPHILKWWTPAHDQLIEQAIQEYQWQWYWHIREKICALTPSEVLETWKRSDPACKSHAWYNVLMYFSSARAIDRGFDKLVREPSEKHCRLCGLLFREDSLPAPLIERIGVEEIECCSPCLSKALLEDGANEMSADSVCGYIRDLTQALSRIPPSDYGRNVGDLHGMSGDERLTVFRVLERKPSVKRVKQLFGSWLNALIKAGVLEDDVRQTRRGTQCMANDGHVCLSLGEKTIDDLLFALGIEHKKEPKYPEGNYRADFLIGDIFIEYFGLAGDASYDERARIKAAICAAHSIKLIAIYPRDLSSVRLLKSKILDAMSS
jgi:hypothetical protein